MNDWAPSNFQVVSWVLIVIGWLIVNAQNNLRETRKEARAMSDNAKELAIDTASNAYQYMTTDSINSVELKSSLEVLEIELERFPDFGPGGRLIQRFNDFADAITGGDFETKDRTVKTANSREVNALFQTRNSLLAEIEFQFKQHYC